MADPPTKKKKGFGEKLKGIGKAIGRQAKKVPGYTYREVVKPYGEHLASKFTEPVVSTPTLKRRVTPGAVGAYRAEKTTVSREEPHTVEPYRPEQRTRLKRARQATPGQGRTASYDRTGKSAVERLSEISHLAGPIEKLPIGMGRKAGKRTKRTRKRVISPTPDKKPAETRGAPLPEFVTVVGGVEPIEPKRPGMTKKKPARKFSPKRTAKTFTEAAKKRKEAMEKVQIDRTAEEMARLTREQELAREAQRIEAELKEGRRPRREKARYRYRVRGTRRNEGRGR